MSLELAIRYAKENPIRPRGRSSISRFCSILSDGHSHYRSFNLYRSHPLQARFAAKTGNPEKISIHSELGVIVKAIQKDRIADFSRFTLYVARVLADDTPALARPCMSCWAAITEFGINKVEYTE